MVQPATIGGSPRATCCFRVRDEIAWHWTISRKHPLRELRWVCLGVVSIPSTFNPPLTNLVTIPGISRISKFSTPCDFSKSPTISIVISQSKAPVAYSMHHSHPLWPHWDLWVLLVDQKIVPWDRRVGIFAKWRATNISIKHASTTSAKKHQRNYASCGGEFFLRGR